MRHARTRLVALATLALAAALVAGCGAEKAVKRGRSALQSGQGGEAVRQFEQALREEPDLREDPDFMAALTRARYLSAYQEGRRAADRGDWAAAVRRLEQALEVDPAAREARDALAATRGRAAEALHGEALALADTGRLDAAGERLAEAATYEPEAAEVRVARASLANPAGATGPAGEAYRAGLAAAEADRWGAAAERYRAAVTADANFLPARAELHRAEAAIGRAGERHRAGLRHLEARALDAAIAALEAALDVWPTYPEALAALERARAERAQVDALVAEARAAVEAGRYPAAVSAAERAAALYPAYGPAAGLADEVARRAAAAHVARGTEALEAGRVDEAEAAYREALASAPGHRPARDGLGRADAARARAAEDAGRHGEAFLHWMNATRDTPAAWAAEGAARARARALAGHGFTVGLQVTDALGARTPQAARLETAVARGLAAAKPGFLTLEVGRGGPEAIAVELAALDVRRERVRTENRTHGYVVGREVANPERPALERELARERVQLARMLRLHRQVCGRCGGHGRVACTACRGSTWVACTACGGSGRIGGAACHLCGGRGQLKCPHCGRGGYPPGWVECPVCHGRGRAGDVSDWDLRRQQDRVEDLQRRLDRTPGTVIEETREQWPYTREVHQVTALASARLRGGGGGPETLEAGARATDETIRNANPEVGLPPDPLELPDEETLVRDVTRGLAEKAVRAVLARALGGRAAALEAEADRLAARGDAAAAREARVGAALVLEPVEAGAAAERLERLREGLAPAR